MDRQIRADLMELGSVLVWGEPNDTRGNVYRIASTCGTVFDEDNFLCALDLKLTDSDMAAVDPSIGLTALKAYVPKTQVAPEDTAEVVSYTGKIRKRDRWLKTELDASTHVWMILINVVNYGNCEIDWKILRIVLLDWNWRCAIRSIHRSLNRKIHLPSSVSWPVRNLSVSFDRNSALLGQEHFVLLNEVFEQLARLPQDRVLITGYTDASGSPSVNLKLSELRAKAVRNYLLERGIHAERLMVNYYGDSRSMGRAPDERRVEIEWLAR
ncbi:MAG: OmpA family protein [Flavobacteriales bacterium]|nr:OmpA family protein [Flavobacteriales bacterium]